MSVSVHAPRDCVWGPFWAAAFRAAFAFAMLSRKALDDLDTFFSSTSGLNCEDTSNAGFTAGDLDAAE